jgi:hypothetical protein
MMQKSCCTYDGFEVLTAVVTKSLLPYLVIHAGFFPGFLFSHEDGGYMFPKNVSCLSVDYIAVYARR